jgi:hypothetical protein
VNQHLTPEIHHFGFGTKNIVETEKLFKNLGFIPDSDLIIDDVLGVAVKFYKIDGSKIKIELVSPISDLQNPIKSILEKRPGFYHMAFYSNNFLKTAKALDLKAIDESKPAKAFNGLHVQFFVSRDLSIIELIEKK